MPLSAPVERELLHNRDIELRGYHRADGLFDVEASITDTKSYAFSNTDRGEVTPGVPLHRMLARMTVGVDMVIAEFEANTEFGPFSICPDAAPSFARLAGIKVGPGFVRACNERVGGVHGCTHLRELLQQMATVAFQTMLSKRGSRAAGPNAVTNAVAPGSATAATPPPRLLNTCLAYASDSPVVKRTWPDFYTGQAETRP